jgi:hypothetical protein
MVGRKLFLLGKSIVKDDFILRIRDLLFLDGYFYLS